MMQVHEKPELLEVPATRIQVPRTLQSLNNEFSDLLALVCEAIDEFRHYDTKKIALSIGRSKNKSRFGVWAHIAPLSYVGGKSYRRAKRAWVSGVWEFDRTKVDAKCPGALYVMTFLLPKFFRLKFEERIETLVHELYHIHPEFRGDLRRFAGPNVHHGPTPAAFKRRVRELAQKALRNFPQLKEHPLLHADESYMERRKYFRVDLPRKIFRPDSAPLNLWQRLTQGFLIFAFFFSMLSMAATKSVEVRILKKGFLLSEPSLKGEKSRSLQGYEVFQARRLNYNRTWVYVEDNLGIGGWIPRTQVAVVQRRAEVFDDWAEDLELDKKSAKNELSDREKIPGSGLRSFENDEEIEDPVVVDPRRPPEELAVGREAFSNRDGRLYALPDPKSERLGIVERDDKLFILEHSPQGKWVRGRLQETGEEGWIPVRWLEEVRPDQSLGKFFEILPYHVESSLGFGTKDHNFGLGAGFFFRGRRPIAEGKWVRNIQIGVDTNYFVGAKASVPTNEGITKEFSVAYLVSSALARFVFSPRKSPFAFGPEAGLTYQLAFVSTNNISEEELAAAKIDQNPSYLGILGGLRGFLSLTSLLYVQGGVRVYFMTDTFVTGDVGLGARF